MDATLSKAALEFFGKCDLAKGLTGQTPENGTQCWLFNMDENGRLNAKCAKCPYSAELQTTEAIRFEERPLIAVIVLPQELSEKQIPELKKVIDTLLPKDKKALVFDSRALEQIHTGALGLLLRTYKTLKERKSEFFLIQPGDLFMALLRSTKLSKILPIARSAEEVEEYLNKQDEAVKSGEAKRKEEERLQRAKEQETLRCYDFWKGHNTQNATPCAVCHYKASASKRPCWIIDSQIEGITFEYTNEECLDCNYYQRLNPNSDVQELL